MRTKSILIKCVVLLVIFLVKTSDSRRLIIKHKDKTSDVRHNIIPGKNQTWNTTSVEKGRGFFGHGGIFSLGKVLNFFPVGGERECQPEAYTVARAGICLNPYDCRQRDGKAAGDCAHGLGVCCVFEVTCGGTVQNNLTYFMSPGFPELWPAEKECSITIEKAFAGIMQLRIDFVHFTIGQPNRRTGECDEDAMVIGEGKNNFTVCGQNHGQHIYYTLSTASVAREAGDLPTTKSTRLSILMRGPDMPRLWLLRLAQMPLVTSAPHNCLQYFTGNNGTIKTFNYASNGRHLANQEYRSCVRRNVGHCAIRYSPCDSRSFRIGGNREPLIDTYESVESGPGALGGAGTGFYGPDGSLLLESAPVSIASPPPAMQEQISVQNEDPQGDPSMEIENDPVDNDEGSGADPQIDAQGAPASTPPSKSAMAVIWSYIWPSWLWGQARTLSWRWSPYTQHYKQGSDNDDFRYYGYGNFGVGFHGFGRQRCMDRVTIPCESEYFVSSLPSAPGVCDPHHCGSSFCPGRRHQQCRVETSISPFAVSFHFGPPTPKRSPEENIGVCLKYQQLPCES